MREIPFYLSPCNSLEIPGSRTVPENNDGGYTFYVKAKYLRKKHKSDLEVLKDLKQILFNPLEQSSEEKVRKLDEACLDQSGEDWIELDPSKWEGDEFDDAFNFLIEISTEILRWNQRINAYDIEFNGWLDHQLSCAMEQKFRLNKKANSLLDKEEDLKDFFSRPVSFVQWEINRNEADNFFPGELEREVVYRFEDFKKDNAALLEADIRDYGDEVEAEKIRYWHEVFLSFSKKYFSSKTNSKKREILSAAIAFGISFQDYLYKENEYLSYNDINDIFALYLHRLELLRASSLSSADKKKELEELFPGASSFIDFRSTFTVRSSYLRDKETISPPFAYDELKDYLSNLSGQAALIKFQVNFDERCRNVLYFWDGIRIKDIFAASQIKAKDPSTEKAKKQNPIMPQARWILNDAIGKLLDSPSDNVYISIRDIWVERKYLNSDPMIQKDDLLKMQNKTGKIPSGKSLAEARGCIKRNGLVDLIAITSLNEPTANTSSVELHELNISFKLKVLMVIEEKLEKS